MSEQNASPGLDSYLSTSSESGDEHDPLENADDEIDEYEEARYGRQRLLEKPYSNWDESYDICPSLLLTIKSRNPQSVVVWKTQPGVTSDQVIFQRVFWAFGPCINGFRNCFPVILVDSLSLTGKYKGALLTASSREGCGMVVPIAFAIVETECTRSWSWFVNCLQKHVTDRNDICIISDRNAGLHRAIKDIGRGWTWRWCLRHYVDSYKESITDPLAIDCMSGRLWTSGAINQSKKFAAYVAKIFKSDVLHKLRSTDWVEQNQLYWSLARDNEAGAQRNGILTTSINELTNSVLKGVCDLPIATLVCSTFLRTMQHFEHRRYEVGEEWNRMVQGYNGYSGYCNAIMKNRTRKAWDHLVNHYDGSKEVFKVKTPTFNPRTPGRGIFTVTFNHQNHTGMCTCGKFQATKMPCSHAIAVCLSTSIKKYQYVSDLYALVNVNECYRESFVLIGGYRDWMQHSGPTLIPDAASMHQDETAQDPEGA